MNTDQTKGRIKQAAGDLTGDDDLKRDGEHDESAGNAKAALRDVEDKAEELVDKVKDAVHKD